MPDTPAQSPPLPPDLPKESVDLCFENPKPSSDSETPSENHQPLALETQHLHAPNPADHEEPSNPHQEQREEPQIVSDDQEQDDPEPEQEGMSVPLSPPSHSSISDTHNALETKGNPPVSSVRRFPKRKKGFTKNYKSLVALKKKLQTLSQNLNPIPFVPGKVLDFSRHEELLKRLGLWEFSHIEFDRSLRTDLIAKLVSHYNPKQRGSYVNDCRIGVNRADLGRALKLPAGKKVAGDCDMEEYPAEFLSFLDEFVSNWMLLHEDLWCTPTEVVNWLNCIKDRHPEKVDWAGLIWFMVEKELAQGSNLKNCYYASHLQQLIKVQREDLLRKNAIVQLTVEEDEDVGDVKMLDAEESSLEGQKQEDQNVELKLGQDIVAVVENAGEVDKVEKFEDVEKVETVDDGHEIGSADEVQKMESVEGAEHVENVDFADEHMRTADNADEGIENADEHIENTDERIENADERIENDDECIENDDERIDNDDEGIKNDDERIEKDDERIEKADEQVENGDNADERVENGELADEHVENVENAREVSKDMDMMDFGYCKGDGQGQWLLDGKDDGGQHFLQRCRMDDVKASSEDRGQDGDGEDMEEEDNEEDGHVEGFKFIPKGPLDGMASANFVQAFETGQLQFTSPELGGQSSLELMSSRTENNVILGGPSMFNHFGKRQIGLENDISHHALNNNHKKMKIDSSWDQKPADFDMCMQQMQQWYEKAKMGLVASRDEAYQQATVTEQIMSHQIAEKDNEIMQLRCKFDELQRRRQADIHHRDRELYLMNSVIDGYRRALKEAQKEFTEFRKQHAISNEPIYKDAGNGGVVKSIMELEKERIKQEEEKKMMCHLLEETYKKHLNDYIFKWEELLAKVHSLDSRLQNASKEVESLKDHLAKSKSSVTALDEC